MLLKSLAGEDLLDYAYLLDYGFLLPHQGELMYQFMIGSYHKLNSKNGLSGLSLPALNSSQGAWSVVVTAVICMSINKPKMSLCSAQLTAGMVLVSESGTMRAHRVWETKDYSCCVTDKRTGQQTDLVTCLSSHRVHRKSWTFLTPFWSPIHKFIHLQRKKSDEFASQESNFPIWLIHFSANDPLLSKPLVLSCIVRELKLGLTANIPATNAS